MQIVQPTQSFDRVHDMLRNSLSAKAVVAAVELKVFDALEGEPLSALRLADRLGLMADRLEPVLDILAAAEIVHKDESGYVNTPLASEFFVSSSPLYQGVSVQMNMAFSNAVENSIVELVAGKEIDRAAMTKAWGADEIMEGTAQHALGTGVSPVTDAVSGLPGFADFRTMGDIGGNHGLYSLGVMSRNDALRGTVFDLPAVAEKAQDRFEALGYGDRLSATGLDLRSDSLPAESLDLILISHVLYIFKDDLRATIKRLAAGVRPGGWFVSHHYASREDYRDRTAAASLELLTRLCGYSSHFLEREELEDALALAGFTDVRFRQASEHGFGLITTAHKPF